MASLTIIQGNAQQTVPIDPDDLLSARLRQAVPAFALPCAGNHTCGKCRVHVSGAVEPPSAEECALLGEDALARGIRLACFCRLTGDAAVTLAATQDTPILAWNSTPPFARTETGCGFAVDIGTTTVAMQLFDRESGTVLAERLAENAQRGFGADVISRIEACKTEGLAVLSGRIRDQLEELAAACMQQAGVTHIEKSVVTGNATMLHLFEGLDPAPLAVVPFNVQSHFGCMSRHTLAGAPVYLPRCVGAYVGADIICAILASDLLSGGVQLLADIGTNGEMALAQNGRLLCCATAAGPAFEGAGLSCGMPAAPSAVCAVTLRDGTPQFRTVQDAPIRGICGSGILDALAVMLETEAMDETGYLDEDFPLAASDLYITQRDVRQIQLAKSAVCAGILTLLEQASLPPEAVTCFSVAGGFGSSMNMASASAIGLFPAALQQKTRFIGNGALGGASMLLMNRALRAQTEQMAREAEEISLSASPSFMDHYIDCMSFETF